MKDKNNYPITTSLVITEEAPTWCQPKAGTIIGLHLGDLHYKGLQKSKGQTILTNPVLTLYGNRTLNQNDINSIAIQILHEAFSIAKFDIFMAS